ncbi:MAG: phosphopantothenoylcysteine decarboxylase / phosphopantothenate---cysteine ligase, partial [Candidatus Hydrogenedentes bacterium]|nr:phosphopantothenoylcysteine decarboxylase / phosphopantothenate---cysteine ligase [Candidatus Hydrogenedentota bacterium]
MRTISSKEIVLGVTGSIAAYKACEVASRLVKLGIRVIPVLTRSAQELVGAASLEGITGQRAITQMFAPFQNQEVEHIAAANRADLFLIAPATANVIAKAAHGIADDWLSTTLLATRAPILFAPAMNTDMYTHAATQANMEILRARGCRFVGPASGRLACGTDRLGRMIDPAIVVEPALPLLRAEKVWAGKIVLITSGGNHEQIDPVRFIGNRSSGKMGRALALAALARGAAVTVVTGPAEVEPPYGAEVVRVETAREMADAVLPLAKGADIVIGAAAVADYRVEQPGANKHKRSGVSIELMLVENPDILAAVGAAKRPGQIVVGFAAETQDLLENAAKKLVRKNLDLIVANEVGTPESGFGTNTVKAILLGAGGRADHLPLMAKDNLSENLMDDIDNAILTQ